jgi:hypothetical protein
MGATNSPGHCKFHSALPTLLSAVDSTVLPKFSTEFLAETKFAQRYTRMALPICYLSSFEVVLQNYRKLAEGITRCATQSDTQRRYQLAPGIKEFKFITLLGG